MTVTAERPLAEAPGFEESRSGNYDFGVGAVVHINAPARYTYRKMLRCFNCEQVRRCVVTQAGVWYSATATCCHCGDSWADGEALERPFARGWRKKAVAKARKQWDESAAYDKRIVRAMLDRESGRG